MIFLMISSVNSFENLSKSFILSKFFALFESFAFDGILSSSILLFSSFFFSSFLIFISVSFCFSCFISFGSSFSSFLSFFLAESCSESDLISRSTFSNSPR